MIISVPLINGLLPDRYGKYAPNDCKIDGHPCVSFPIEISDVPEGTESLALTLTDYDSIPVCGFTWIHWLACNIDPKTKLIPQNVSQSLEVEMTQGANSNWSPLGGGLTNPRAIYRYTGPCPPDKTHYYTLEMYALDKKLDLPEGYYQNEFRRAIRDHVLDSVYIDIPSRA
ncbi:MAG: YbhB/YbcL family Raf kinase inhibitor-like protein [Eggerthellaceae bacterium]|nr:YbhB/YbcL family Raf kinase inhibitor-like protein [Eggerthellaceae bacterium]